jgi:L-ascorbate metabolism protein UlaG (beta-lactamase superfamily)
VFVAAVSSAHPSIDLDEAGQSKYLGYRFEMFAQFAVKAIYHSGDTVVYDGLADRVRALGPIDIAILPINGKVGNMGGRDAARLAKEIGAKLVIPCHYDMFEFNTADPKDEFIPECERIGQAYRVLQVGERLTQ